MIETANILNQATHKSLVLMDEVGRGTATTDGLAIAHACINRLLAVGCLTLFATHYFELTQLGNDQQNASTQAHTGIRNVHVTASEVDGQLLLLHRIREGAASSSFGLHVAKMAGIPKAVLDDAKGYLLGTPSFDPANLDPANLDTVSPDTLNNHTYQTRPNRDALDDKIELAQSQTAEHQHHYQHSTALVAANPDTQATHLSENKLSKQLLSIHDTLKRTDPDSLTPKQAQDLLYTLKQLISR